MDPSLYCTIKTTRGINYSVYHAEGTDAAKPTILFVHGFPSSSYDWRHQVSYFHQRGHGIIVPDLLGYGSTDKPTDTALYAASLIGQDLIDILDAKNVQRVLTVGHDWGSKVVSILANLHSERFLGFAFLVVGYVAPNTSVTYPQILAFTASLAKYELFGYWGFFSEDDAPTIIKEHFDSFFGALVGAEPAFAKEHIGPTGAFRTWLLENKSVPLPDYLSEEEFKTQKDSYESSVESSLCWYKVVTGSVDREDAKSVPLENYTIKKPVFFGAANQDVISLAALGKGGVVKNCTNATIKEYEAGHWAIWEAKDDINRDLEAWIATL